MTDINKNDKDEKLKLDNVCVNAGDVGACAGVWTCVCDTEWYRAAAAKPDRYRAAARGDKAWEEFMLGVDPAWHEYKGPIKQDD